METTIRVIQFDAFPTGTYQPLYSRPYVAEIHGHALDDLANRFAINLVKLQQAPQTTPEIGKALRSVAIKWNYIEKSLQNYNQNSVPFLINKYSDRIIEDLEEVSGLYAAQQS